MKILVSLEQVDDPDDGMITVKTGCVDGNGKEDIAIISEKCILMPNRKIEKREQRRA